MYIDKYESFQVVRASEGYVLALRGNESGIYFINQIMPLEASIEGIIEIPKDNIPVYLPQFDFDTEEISVGELQQYLISQSKSILKNFLEKNPVSYSGKFFSVTSDAQAHLQSVISAADNAARVGMTYTPTWNAVDEVRQPYDIEFLRRLLVVIQNYVLIFVLQQQEMEEQILNIQEKEELLKFSIVYKKEE